MHRRVAVVVAVHLAIVLASASLTRGKRMNVLMFASDDLRPQLGCYQPEEWAGRHVQMHTPNIDALANRSVVFLRSYCQQVKQMGAFVVPHPHPHMRTHQKFASRWITGLATGLLGGACQRAWGKRRPDTASS